jgi:hypothetical protein
MNRKITLKEDNGDFTTTFNKKMKSSGELRSLKSEYGPDRTLGDINSSIAMRYMSYLASKLKDAPMGSDWKNQSKNPQNHFQIETYLESGNILWATFVYIDDEHQVIKSKSNIELLDSDYNTIKIIPDNLFT